MLANAPRRKRALAGVLFLQFKKVINSDLKGLWPLIPGQVGQRVSDHQTTGD